MSDQFTRIRLGGSVLDPQSPVVGLLFGDETNVSILDAEEIVLSSSEPPAIVQLHQANFPHHAIVGWYRVGTTEPTIQDLQTTLQLQQRYTNKDDNDNNTRCWFFLYLQVSPDGPPDISVLTIIDNVLRPQAWKLHTRNPTEQFSVERVLQEKQQSYDCQTILDSVRQLAVRLTHILQQQQQLSPAQLRDCVRLVHQVGLLQCRTTNRETTKHKEPNASAPLSVLSELAQTVNDLQTVADQIWNDPKSRAVPSLGDRRGGKGI